MNCYNCKQFPQLEDSAFCSIKCRGEYWEKTHDEKKKKASVARMKKEAKAAQQRLAEKGIFPKHKI